MKKSFDISKVRDYFNNTPHTEENRFIIVSFWLCDGVNCILLRFISSSITDGAKKPLIVMGIILIAVALLSIVEHRPQMTGTGYTIICGVIHLIFCTVFAFQHSWIWMIIYLIEAAFLCGITVYRVYRK